jgi:hypothetical protein
MPGQGIPLAFMQIGTERGQYFSGLVALPDFTFFSASATAG